MLQPTIYMPSYATKLMASSGRSVQVELTLCGQSRQLREPALEKTALRLVRSETQGALKRFDCICGASESTAELAARRVG